MFKVEYYELPNGDEPAKQFIDSLDYKMRAKALGYIEILMEYGNALREPHSKPLRDGIFELRVKFAGDISRILYFFYVDNKIILTHGFIKKTQKTPPSEIALALKYKADYEGRQKSNERF